MENKICFLFGHATCPDDILPKLAFAIQQCYAEGIRDFYVGHRGNFDRLAALAIKAVKQEHPDVRLYLLLAYHPGEQAVPLTSGFDGSYYPPLTNVPRAYAIIRANQYMAEQADALICYANHPGNARNLLEYARRRKKSEAAIYNLVFGVM
ncbi:MAG: hypothetical protein J6Q54_00060 [Oscillospiraceae bacterium]|nr:hypothetical protein [Oscillospiraceae bacterium]